MVIPCKGPSDKPAPAHIANCVTQLGPPVERLEYGYPFFLQSILVGVPSQQKKKPDPSGERLSKAWKAKSAAAERRRSL